MPFFAISAMVLIHLDCKSFPIIVYSILIIDFVYMLDQIFHLCHTKYFISIPGFMILSKFDCPIAF